MGNNNFGKYAGIFLISAILSVMVLSLVATNVGAAGRVIGNNTNGSNITTTAIPNTTSSIPPTTTTNVTSSSTPPRATMYVVNGTTPGSIILNGGTQAGSNTTNVTGLDIAWGDGQVSSGVFFPQVHTYANPGSYTIDVTVLQSDGESSTLSTNATVGSAPSTIAQSTAASTVPYSVGAGSSNTLIYVAVIVVVIIILLAAWKMMGKK